MAIGTQAASGGDNVLIGRNLSKVFGGFAAVKHVNLEVKRGSIHALIGPNGAGKTTCFNLLTKTLQPTEGQIIFDGEEDRGFLTSNRPGGKGQDDIWRFFMPNLEFAYQGTVYDKVSQQPIPGVNINVVGTDGSNVNVLTDDNGGFNLEENGNSRYISENTTYSILVTKDGYLVAKDQVTTVGLDESTTFVKEYFLQPASEEVIIKLPEVQYEFDKFALTQNGKDSLETLYQTMVDNPTIIIELRAHTDSRGSDAYNLTLSQNRAQSCVNYLATKGIPLERMVPKGLGESELRISDAEIAKMATEEEREAAHQQNRRTEFRVLSFDYVPQDQVQPEEPEQN